MILVTGASGLLGANLVAHLVERGEDVAAACHGHPFQAPGARVLRADLASAAEAEALVKDVRPDCIINCAALTDVDGCQSHPAEARRLNAEAPGVLARAAKRGGAVLAHISTSAVFDGARGGYAEEDEPGPVNVYAESKLAGERAVREAAGDWLIVRTDIYGWNMQDKKSLAEWVLDKARAGQPVPGFRDVFFSPLLANDLSEALYQLLKKSLRGTFHAAASERCSKYDFARRLLALYGERPESVRSASIQDAPLKAPRPRDASLRTDKIRAALGRPMPGVSEGLERFRALDLSGHARRLKEWRKSDARV